MRGCDIPMKKLSNSSYVKLVGLVCVLCVGTALWDYVLGSILLVIFGVPMALWYNHRLKREQKWLESAGILGLIHCECFEGGPLWHKGDRILICVYPSYLSFLDSKGAEQLSLTKQELSAAGVFTLDEVRTGFGGAAFGKLRDTILEADQISRKKSRRGSGVKYLILNLKNQVLSFYITAADQHENHLCSDISEGSLIQEWKSKE